MTGLASPRRGAVALALLALLAVQAGMGLAPAGAAPATDAKRRAPADVPPLLAGGLRIEAPRLGAPYGYDQDGGIVVARRADTGALVWTRRIYAAPRDAAIEGDKQDVFIRRLALTPDRRRLVVVDERGRTFELRLDDGLRAAP